jgi:acetyl esterase/lipase
MGSPWALIDYTSLGPAFLAWGGDGQVSEDIPNLYQALKTAGVPAELHVFAGVGHGFGIRATNSPRFAGWVRRFWDWMADRGLLAKN